MRHQHRIGKLFTRAASGRPLKGPGRVLFEIGNDLGRHTGGVYRQTAGVGQQMKDIDGLLVGATELGDEFGNRRGELEDTVFDELQRKG